MCSVITLTTEMENTALGGASMSDAVFYLGGLDILWGGSLIS